MLALPLKSGAYRSHILILTTALLTASTSGIASTQPYITSHQINFGTGNKYLQVTDVTSTGPGPRISFTRTYNSQSTESSILGHGWTTSMTEKLIIDTAKITLIQSGGRHVQFPQESEGLWVNKIGTKRVITSVTGGYQLRETKGDVKQFDSNGKLLSFTDTNGNKRTYSYDGNELSTISNNFGKSLNFTYNDDKLSSATGDVGTYTYSYDTNNNLTTITNPDTTSISYIYDDPNDAHNLTGIINEEGVRTLTVEYDYNDRVVRSAKQGGAHEVTITYSSGTQRQVTNSVGVSTTYNLDILHGVAKVDSFSGPGCSSCGSTSDMSYIYDDRFRLLEKTDTKGKITSYSYDASGNKLSKTEAFGTALEKTTSYTYTAENKIKTVRTGSVVDGDSHKEVASTYDASGNLQTRTETGKRNHQGNTLTLITGYTYNSDGQLTSIDGPRDDVDDIVNITYYANEEKVGNNRGQLHTVTNGLGHVTTYSNYNVHGKPETITDENGEVFTRIFNSRGQLVSSASGGLTTGYVYNSSGDLLRINRPGSSTITYDYDSSGRANQITDTEGNSINYTFDSEGRRTAEEVRDPSGTLTRFVNFTYNDAGQIDKVILPGDAERIFKYDNIGNLIQSVNARGLQTDLSYDLFSRLESSLEGTVSTSYQYDSDNNITAATDAQARTTSFTYDDFNNRLSRTASDTGSTFYSYDKAGNLETITDALSRIVGFSYDALNRPVRQTSGSKDILFTYDKNPNGIGRLSSITDEHGSRSFLYNTTGTLANETRQIGAQNYTTSYTYSATTGNLSTITYPSATAVQYNRNSDGQIVSVNVDGTTIIDAITRLPFGPLKTAQLAPAEGTGIPLLREYDQRYQLMSYKVGKATTPVNYTRNAEGSVTSISNILDPTPENISENYTYDPVNNRLSVLGAKTYTYDAVGNMVSDGNVTFTYDELNRIIRVNKDDTIVASYGYDSSNRRIIKTVGTTTTHYLYDARSNLIGEALADGTPLRDYIYLDSEILALKEYKDNPGLYYYINDHLGTPQQLIKSDGTIVWHAAYLPFGKAQVIVDQVKNNIRFPGQYFDAETGLHYNWNRYYDPDTGRYVSADPIGLVGGMNLYAYVGGNPVNAIDPKGLSYYYGKWCGSNWTGGYKKPWDQLTDGEKRNTVPPQDALDSCCQDHDRCHATCRDRYPCDDDERSTCYEKCDRALDRCAEKSQSGLFGWLLQQYMDSSKPGSGLNDPNCPSISPWVN